MIKYIMRKTIYKKSDRETQDMLLSLVAQYHIIQFLCLAFWVVIYIFPLIPIFIIQVCEGIEFSITTEIALMAFMLICFISLLVFYKVFMRAIAVFSLLLAEKIYFLVCTKKGKALSKKDFETIKQVNEDLYALIATQECRGCCYAVCFEMLKALKKGMIEFIAVKKFSFQKDEEDDDGKNFTMHVLYVNNGWAFDVYSSRQYPIDKLHEIFKAKIYKTFNFEEIKDKSYDEFSEEQRHGLTEWANMNDCSEFRKNHKKES